MDETTEKIEKINPKFVNIVVYGQNPSASTPLMLAVGLLCKTIKKINPSRKIILSGLHPSALPKRTLEEEDCDFVCEGEGFYTLFDILNGKTFSEIKGLWYKVDNKIFSNIRPDNVKDLDKDLSDVAWDLLPMEKYKAHNWHCFHDLESRKSYAAFSTSLGCPYHCSFCCINAPFGKHYYRTWSTEWVMKQLDILVNKYSIKNIKIIDELFIFNLEHFIPIAKKIIEKRYTLNFWAYARVDTTKSEYLELLKKAGFNWLALGIESGSSDIRKSSFKGCFDQEDIRDVVKRIKDSGINVGGNYIFGLPGDTLESMQKTLDLSEELNCEWSNFYCAMAYPGSKLYNNSIGKGILPDDKGGPGWIGYSQYSYECLPLPTKNLSAAEVLKFRDEAFNIYFSNPKYLNFIEQKFGKSIRQHIEEMIKIKLKRKILEK
jgi:radical SAM superfamily enzyme YgiQ (UPF0313 family)